MFSVTITSGLTEKNKLEIDNYVNVINMFAHLKT